MQAWGAPGSPGRGAAGAAAAEGAGPWGTPASAAFAGSTIMYGALLLFESEFVHIVAISFTSLILTELLMVALTIQTWHWLMTVAELLSLACYIASLVFLHEFIGKTPSPPPPPATAWQLGPGALQASGGRPPPLDSPCALCPAGLGTRRPPFCYWRPLGASGSCGSASWNRGCRA